MVQASVVRPYTTTLLPQLRHIDPKALESQPECAPLVEVLPRAIEGSSSGTWRLLHRDIERAFGGVSGHLTRATKALARSAGGLAGRARSPQAASAGVHVVLISRQSASTTAASTSVSRVFVNASHVRRRLERAVGLPVVSYTGHEDVRQTLLLFGRAAGIVGYHGAGLANAVFVPHATCVVEISTYLNGTSSPWRAHEHRRTLAWSPELLSWQYYRLPLAQVLAANGVQLPADAADLRRHNARQRRNDFIKTLRYVGLRDDDVDKVGRTLRQCILRRRQGSRAHSGRPAGGRWSESRSKGSSH